jgi:hypothetical protein
LDFETVQFFCQWSSLLDQDQGSKLRFRVAEINLVIDQFEQSVVSADAYIVDPHFSFMGSSDPQVFLLPETDDVDTCTLRELVL